MVKGNAGILPEAQVNPLIIKTVRIIVGAKMPPGRYAGKWEGHIISLTINGDLWKLTTENNQRGGVRCTVVVGANGEPEAFVL